MEIQKTSSNRIQFVPAFKGHVDKTVKQYVNNTVNNIIANNKRLAKKAQYDKLFTDPESLKTKGKAILCVLEDFMKKLPYYTKLELEFRNYSKNNENLRNVYWVFNNSFLNKKINFSEDNSIKIENINGYRTNDIKSLCKNFMGVSTKPMDYELELLEQFARLLPESVNPKSINLALRNAPKIQKK